MNPSLIKFVNINTDSLSKGPEESIRGKYKSYANLNLLIFLYYQKQFFKQVDLTFLDNNHFHHDNQIFATKYLKTKKIDYEFFPTKKNVRQKWNQLTIAQRKKTKILTAGYKNFILISENKNFYIPEDLKETLKTRETQYLMPVYLGLYTSDGLHANMLFFNKKKKYCEIFEPHGSKRNKYQNLISKLIKKKTGFKLKEISSSCPYLGPQRKANAYHGMCLTWTVLITNLYLLNHKDFSLYEVQKQLLELDSAQLKSILLRYNKMLGNFLKDL